MARSKMLLGGLRATYVNELSDLTRRARRMITQAITHTATHRPVANAGLPMEMLEKRQLLAGISLTSGVLTITSTDNARHAINVSKNSAGSYVAKYDSTAKTYAGSSVSSIKISGGNWNDTIRVESSVTKGVTINGNAGNDYISGGGGADNITGGSGNDTAYGNGGNDSLFGSDGNDYLDGGTGTDKLDGGVGTDTLKNGETSATPAPKPTPAPAPAPSSSAASISSIELWNTDTNSRILNIDPGNVLDLSKLPAHYAIVAQGTGASAKFVLDSNTKVESSKPWAYNGDSGGKLKPMTLSTGSHKITVTAYTKASAAGTAGTAKTVSFSVTKSSTSTGGTTTGGGTSTGGGTTTPTTGGGTSNNTSTGIVPRDNSAASPRAAITAVSSTTIHAGQSFHAYATNSSLGAGNPLTARYAWDFDDAGSQYNTLLGFNAAHLFSKPGTYDVKLTVTNEAGKSNSVTTTVHVLDAGRKKIYVSASGSDSNDGLSDSKPLKSFAKAASKVADNTEILFRGGDTFTMGDSMSIYKNNVVIGSYGSGKATIRYQGPKDYTAMIWLGGQGGGEVTVQNLIFDSQYTGADSQGIPQAIGAAGKGDAVIGNTFLNVDYGVNCNSNPSGLLVQGNDAPLRTGLKEYFTWAQGDDLVFLGNNVANTLYGADIRSAGTDRLNITGNTFANPTDAQYGDKLLRGTITIHKGSYLYAANNSLSQGSTSIGPLGNGDGLSEKSARLNYAVLEGNVIDNSPVILMHGLNHVSLRNNIVKQNDSPAIDIQEYNSQYGRGVADVTIVNNTGYNTGKKGSFLRVEGPVNGINLINNLYLAPNLYVGTDSTAPVLVFQSDLSSFNKITGNVWPSPSIDWYAEGGVNYVWNNWSNQDGYRTPSEWEGFGVVIKDYYNDVSFNSSTFAPAGGSTADGASGVWAGVFTDKNGKIRSNSGSWTAGAIEV